MIETIINWLKQPWPWYVAGPIAGLMVPLLLITGNKTFGISSSLRHVCAACFPGNVSFFKYNWKKESWNLLFAAGILLGGVVGGVWLANPNPINIAPETIADLQALGMSDFGGLMPTEIFSTAALFSPIGLFFFVIGGFLVGFGTRYAGGCTSGHTIMGLSNLQWPSLVATISFMAGGFIMTHLLLPFILSFL